MSTHNTSAQNGTDYTHSRASHDQLLTRHAYIGRDASGYDHHLDRDTYSVHRIDPETGTRERVSDLSTHPDDHAAAVDVYVHDYIGARVGWAGRRFSTISEWLPMGDR